MATMQNDAPPVLKMTAIAAMTQTERIATFKSKDLATSRLFIECGKLLVNIREGLKDPAKARGLLIAQGVRPGSVNNASNAALVITALVTPKLVTEAVYDTFRWDDITAINSAMGDKSQRPLAAQEVADLIRLKPESFADELESIAASGDTIAEAKAKAAAKTKQDEEKRLADEAAKQKAFADQLKAEEESRILKDQIEKLQQQQPAGESPPTDPVTDGADTPDQSQVTSHKSPPVETEIPTNVVPMPPPPADPDAQVSATLAALDTILKTAQGFTKAGKEAIGLKLMEVNDALFPTAADKSAGKKKAA